MHLKSVKSTYSYQTLVGSEASGYMYKSSITLSPGSVSVGVKTKRGSILVGRRIEVNISVTVVVIGEEFKH